MQSSQGGLGITDGYLTMGYREQLLCKIKINQNVAYPFAMLENAIDNNLFLTRIYFSLQEIDDTLKVHNQKEFNLCYSIYLDNT